MSNSSLGSITPVGSDADHRGVERLLALATPAPPRHRARVLRLEAEIAHRAEGRGVACHGLLGGTLCQLGAEEVGVQLAQAGTDPVRRRLGDDEQGEHEQTAGQHDREPGRADRCERPSQHPADHATAGRECAGAVRGLGLAAEYVAEHAHAAQHDRGADAEATVVVHARRMPEEPDGEDQHDHRQREGDAAEQAAEGVVVEGDRDILVRCEPLDDRADDGENDQQERHAVASLVLRQRLFAEQPCRATHDVGEAHPRAREQTLLWRCVLRQSLCRLGARARRVPRRPRT